MLKVSSKLHSTKETEFIKTINNNIHITLHCYKMATKSHCGLVEHVILSIFISKLSYSRMSGRVQIDGALQQHLWAA